MLLKAADKGQSNQMLEVLTTDNQASLNRKRKRAENKAPSFMKVPEIKPTLTKVAPTVAVTDTVMVPAAEATNKDDSYEFEPVCYNCSG